MFKGVAGAVQPGGAAVPVPERYQGIDRRRLGRRAVMSKRLLALRDWVDARFPLLQLWNDHLARYYAPKKLQLLVFLRFAGPVRTADPDRHRHLADHELQAVRGKRVRLGRIYHARRGMGLVDPLHALHRRVRVLCRDLPAHVPAPCCTVPTSGPGNCCGLSACSSTLPLMGEAFFGYLLPWGQMSLLGRPGDHLAVRRVAAGGRRAGPVDTGRFRRVRRDPEPVLLPARHCFPPGAVRPRGRAHYSPARGWFEQPRRHRDKGPQRPRWRALGRHSVPHPYYTVKDIVGVVVFLIIFCAVVFFQPEMGGYFLEAKQLYPRRPAHDPGTHRAGMVLHAVLRHPAGRAEPVRRRGRHGRGDAAVLFPALAGPESGQVHPLPGLEVQDRPGPVHGQLPGAGLAGPAACHNGLHLDGACLHPGLLPVFPADAVFIPQPTMTNRCRTG